MKDPNGIVPYGDKSGGLIPAGDVEAARRSFETPKREETFSEILNYYAKVKDENAAQQAKALIPFIASKLPSLLSKYNTMENARREAGGDKKRREIEDSLVAMISYDEGIRRLRNVQKRNDQTFLFAKAISSTMKKRVVKDEELYEDESLNLATSLTTEEISWLSVCSNVPSIVFEHRLCEVPAAIDFFWDGVEWALDTLSDKENSFSDRPRDTYDSVGVTGARNDTSFSSFEPKFALGVKALYYSYVEDSYLFDRAMEDLGFGAIMSGDGKLLQSMADKDGVVYSDEYARKNRHRINEFLSGLVLVSALTRKPVSGRDLVKLIGLIDRVPDFLMSGKPAVFIPCGRGVMFLDPATLAELHYAPFDPYVSHYAQAEVYHSSYAIDRHNVMWLFIFDVLRKRIVEKNEAEGKKSDLEAVAEDLRSAYGVEISLGVRKYKLENNFGASVGSLKKNAYTVKMGYWDLRCLKGTLDRIPKRLLKGIKTIERRSFVYNEIESMITGVFHGGSYDRRTGTLEITTRQLPEDVPEWIPGLDASSYEITIAHEVGHAVHFSNPDLFKKWMKLSRASNKFPIHLRKNEFLTAYSSTDKQEDFAESFCCYIVYPEHFRSVAKECPVLRKKYEFMKAVFDGVEFEQLDRPPLDEVAGSMGFDFGLRRRILEEDGAYFQKTSTEAHLEEIRNRYEQREKNKEVLIGGPRILPVEAIDDPEKAEATVDPRMQNDLVNDFKAIDVIRKFFRGKLGARARFVDVEFLELRIDRGDKRLAALDLGNSLGLNEAKALKLIESCCERIEKARESLESTDRQISEIHRDPEE